MELVPVDVWTDDRYLTWDPKAFPDPLKMQADLWMHRTRLVTIVDPHVKRDTNYHVCARIGLRSHRSLRTSDT